jgi:hypothetical protein
MYDLETVFRSIIDIRNAEGKSTIEQNDLLKNFRVMQQVLLDAPEDPSYNKLYNTIFDFLKNCDSKDHPELPNYDYLKEYFEKTEGDEAVLAILANIKGKKPFVGQSYRAILKQVRDQQNILRMERILTNTLNIASGEMTIEKRKHKGLLDSISYFANETKTLVQNTTGLKLESQILSREDSDELLEEYNKVEKDPTSVIGVFTGINKIDEALKGLKNQELMIAAAYTAHCKTTFCLNMAYRALYSGFNTAFVTLEMSLPEIRRAIYVLHSCNPLFRLKCPQYSKLVGNIYYNNVTYGGLTPDEKEYFKIVCEDLHTKNNGYGRFFVWQPDKAKTTVSDVDMKIRQFNYELMNEGEELDFTVLDYITLLEVDAQDRSRDHNQNLNNIIKQLKRLCLTFCDGRGMRMLSPFQVNRDGYKQAKENDGLYNSTALSNAHEAERSADVIISLFVDESERKSGMIKICNLKNRRDRLFDPLHASINFQSKFIYDYVGDNTDLDMMENMERLYSKDNLDLSEMEEEPS